MTEKQILKKVIKIAGQDYPMKISDIPFDHENVEFFIIFSHGFAKAFWNKDTIISKETAIERGKAGLPLNPIQTWEDHLQIMVLQENPIKYLGEFLK